MKLKLNPRLVPICAYYFFLCFGNSILWPYFTLQMRSLGLSLSDTALIGGLAPIFAFVAAPVFGYVGDKVGYKSILIFTILLSIGTSAAMNFVPLYREHVPKVALSQNLFDLEAAETIQKNEIIWFGYIDDSARNCSADFEAFVIDEINCDDKKFDVNISLETDQVFNLLESQCDHLDATACKYQRSTTLLNDSFSICDAHFKDIDAAFYHGSHSLTLWIYFVLRTVLMTAMNACYNISDASATTVTKREGSSFSLTFFFGNIGNLASPFLVGQLLDHVNLNGKELDCLSGEDITAQDFKLPFSISNGILFLMICFTIFCVEIQVDKSEKKMSLKEEFSWILNPAALVFYLFLFEFGFSQGANDTFTFVYAQENLKASGALLSYMQTSGQVSGILILPMVNFLIKKLGAVNMICAAIIFICTKLVLVGITTSSPPWQFIGYYALDGCFPLLWCAFIAYVGKIAPSALTATAISLGSTIIWIAGKGVGTFLSGYLIERYSLQMMFVIVGANGITSTVVYWMIYHMFLKKRELNHENDEKRKSEENAAYEDDKFVGGITKINTRL